MQLVEPALEWASAFAIFHDDFVTNDGENAVAYLEGKLDFPRYVQRLLDDARGIDLPEGYAPCSHFWLINAQGTMLGAIRIRHHIESEFISTEVGHIGYHVAPSHRCLGHGKTMLKLTLSKAKLLGIEQALLIADEDNIASRKAIEANGGVLECIAIGKASQTPLARYWISCE